VSTILQDTVNPPAFIEQDCTFNFDGRSFESGGSYLLKRMDDGLFRALLYAHEEDHTVSTWDGTKQWPARFGHVYRSGFGDRRRSVWFVIDGIPFSGTYFLENSDIVRAKQVRGR
jgi:hypothetical protein